MPVQTLPKDPALQKNGAPGDHGSGRVPEVERHAAPSRWPWFIAVLVIAALAVSIFTRLTGKAPLPVGLIQVNGRMEGDLVTISSKYAGRIDRLLAREGDEVQKGQILVCLEDAELRARLSQAEATAQAAKAQASGAAMGVILTADTTGAQVVQAQGVLNQAQSAVDSARADLLRADAAVTASQSTARAAVSHVAAAQAAVEAANSGRGRAQGALNSAEAEMETARANTLTFEASAAAAKTNYERADRDTRRYAALFKEGAISEQAEDQAASAARAAKAQLDGALQQVKAAKSVEAARRAGIEVAHEEIRSADTVIRQAQAELAAARDQAAAASANVRQSRALHKAAGEAVRQAKARSLQASGQMLQARTAPTQVEVSKAAEAQAQARIDEALSAVRELRSTMDALSIAAPVRGTVTTRFRDHGEVVTAGTPLLDVVDLDRLYLKVYVPETEIGHVRLGIPARIHVDAFSNQHFDATVTYVASAAEFTPKEVQTLDERVKLVYAVKLSLKSNPKHQLTPGMPADAIIQWKPGVPWQNPRW